MPKLYISSSSGLSSLLPPRTSVMLYLSSMTGSVRLFGRHFRRPEADEALKYEIRSSQLE